MFKLPGAATAAEAAVLTAATIGGGGGGDAASAGYRGQQLRSAQRLLRANGVADDNSIGLSTISGSGGEGRVDLEALAQFSQWFPQFAPASLGWGMGDAGGQLGGGGGASESIDPNMLDAGLNSVMVAGGGGGGGAHARRRSQYDWYGLTPSLAAALEAAAATTNAAVAAQAAEEDGAMSSLGGGGGGGGGPFGLGHGALHPSYRRPSMPIFPTFGYPHGDMLGMAGGGGGGGDAGADAGGSAEQQGLYGVAASQDGGSSGAGMVATAAADAVAVALGERSAGADAGGASRRARAAESPPSRRRTMHVPPSLLEGVATAEFASPSAAADALAAQTLGFGPQQHARLASAPYQLRRPVGPATAAAATATAAMTRGRRSRTISSNSSSQQAMARLAAESAMPSAARPPLPPVSEALPATTTAASVQFPLLSSSGLGDMHRQHALAAAGGGGGRHARSLSGTQFTQMDAAAVGMPMDVDLDAMTTLSAAGDYSSSFKAASMWPFGGSGDDDDVHLAAAEEEEEEEHCAGMHDETRSLIEMRGRDAPLPALVDLYRPASSTPTAGGQHHHHRHLGATTTHHSPALMASSSSSAAAAAASPVAPRSAASTPGRREAVGM
ncbi:hypothetical protein GGF38_000984 [Coemansia sp. RSA 25]|nr:hypothetical protein GGF38_000984 [Coemansia sp. RSA 25]